MADTDSLYLITPYTNGIYSSWTPLANKLALKNVFTKFENNESKTVTLKAQI